MRRIGFLVIVPLTLALMLGTGQAAADGWADLDDGPEIDQGIELDPDGGGTDGGDGGGVDDVDDGGDGGDGGDSIPDCINTNGPWDAGDLGEGCGGLPGENDGGGVELPPVNPANLGGQVLDSMLIPSPKVTISPGPPNPTYVNLWTWFWVPESQWVSHSKSVSLRGTTVTVTIEPVHTTWDTGESTVTCDGPGEAWSAGAGEASSCGYEYASTGSVTVSASIGWHASWTCSGVCIADGGDFGVVDSDASSAQLEVRQRQSLVIN